MEGELRHAAGSGPPYRERFTARGNCKAQQCGWLKDKFGLSCEIVPAVLVEMMASPETVRSQRAFQAMLQMKKPDIAKLQAAFEG